MVKIRESRCSMCYTKIVQTGRGRNASRCARCRERAKQEWRDKAKRKQASEEKPIDVVGGSNA